MFKPSIIFILFITLTSCIRVKESQLERVLCLAGQNRKELEKVIHYYSRYEKDSLKLKAAKFLIINMPGHYSISSNGLQKYLKAADTIVFSSIDINVKVDKLNSLLNMHLKDSAVIIEDYLIIKAKYLINNIDMAFDDWENGNWSKSLTFNEFCEYILPYKCIDNQGLDDWRKQLSSVVCDTLIDYSFNDIWNRSSYWAVEAINKKLQECIVCNPTKKLKGHFLYRLPFWGNIPSGSCEVRTNTALAILRSKGFPVAKDFILQWATNFNSHTWLNVRVDHNRGIPCEGAYGGLLADIRPGECKGKIYRSTFSSNRDIVELKRISKDVPLPFQNEFMIDVTSEYVSTVDIVFSVQSKYKKKNEKYAYLTVFGNNKWMPIAFCKIEDFDKVSFKDVEKGAIYMPAYYIDDKIEPISYPALLNDKGQLEYLKPDLNKTDTVILKRKYPLFRKAYITAKRLKGSEFQAANKADFSDAVTVYKFKDYSISGCVSVEDTLPYRYWRYFNPLSYHCNIAELRFFDKNGNILRGKIIGSENRSTNPNYCKTAAFDGNQLTYYASKSAKNGWVGLDFEKPTRINEIGYITRNDGNNVCIGESYELFYWDGIGWKSIGKQIATSFSLIYKNVPQNSLLILRNLTHGKDERIFIYRDDKQVWY